LDEIKKADVALPGLGREKPFLVRPTLQKYKQFYSSQQKSEFFSLGK
jgi:hypothetical protein